MQAAIRGNSKIFKLLVAWGTGRANIHAKDNSGKLHYDTKTY